MAGADTARVIAGGDWYLGRRWATQPGADEAPSRSLLERLREPDLVVANLEVALSRRGTPVDKRFTITLRTDPEIAADLAPFSIKAVSLANNHAMDFGAVALSDTIEAVEACGVVTFGAGPTLQSALQARVMELNGVRVGLLGLSCTLPPGSAATEDGPGVAPVRVITEMEMDPGLQLEQPGSAPLMHTRALEEDVIRAQAVVRDALNVADVVLVMMHWGVPPASIATFYGFSLADYQRPLGHALIDAGAHAVIGHHPHVVHAAEVYRGRLIAYSLGNMAFETPPGFTPPPGLFSNQALLLDLDLDRTGVRAARLLPLQLSSSGMPRLPTRAEADAILGDLQRQSSALGTTLHCISDEPAAAAVLG